MKAIIFPGQGSQKAGMASVFYSNFKMVKDIFVIGDELQITDGSRPAESFEEIENLNTTLFGKKKARINALGFLTGGIEANKFNPECKIAFEESNKSFFNFLRELTSRNDGTLVIR